MHDPDPHEPGVAELARRALADARRWGRAEAAYYKGVAADRASDGAIGIALGFAALMLTQAVLTTLLVGIVLMLVGPLGAGWATLIVVVAALVLIALLGWLALARFKLVARPLPGGDA